MLFANPKRPDKKLLCALSYPVFSLLFFVLTVTTNPNHFAEAAAKLELTDPQQRDAKQLLESARNSRLKNRLTEAVILAYLALKVAMSEQNANTTIEAHAHLFLSESLGLFGYRALERIHAKAAYRAMQRYASQSPGLESGQFYFRLGVVAKDSGDYAVADYYLRHALGVFEAAEPQSQKATISTLIELAQLSIKQADIQRFLEKGSLEKLKAAQDYVDRAMSLTKKTADDLDLIGAVTDLQAHMILRLSSHLPPENQKLADQMLVNVEKMIHASLKRHRLKANNALQDRLRIMNDLVSVLRRTGRFVEAMDVIEEMLNITDQLQRIDIDTVLNMALVSKKLGSRDLTRTACDIVMNSEEARIAEISSLSGEALSLAFSAQARYRSMKCLSVLSASGAEDDKSARQMLDLVLRRKAIVTDAEEAFWETLHGQSSSDLRAAVDNLVLLRNRLSTKVVAGDFEGLWQLIREIEHGEELLSVEPWWREFQEEGTDSEKQALKNYAESILKGMSSWDAISDQKHSFKEQRITADLVAKSLPRDAALVEVVKIDDFDIDRDIFLESAHYWVLILHPGEKTKAIDLGDADLIEREITAHLKALHAGDRLLPESQVQALSKLYDVVWAPFADQLKGINNVIISPDALFALVPFSALVTSDGRFLIEQVTLYLISNGREIVGSKQVPEKKPGRPVIVMDPDFDEALNSTPQILRRKSPYFKPQKQLGRLEATRQEGEIVQKLLGDDVEIYTRKYATEAKLRSSAYPRVLHLATHGLFFELKTSPGQDLNEEDSVARDTATVRHVQTLSRSGLALSGINRGGLGSDEDGLLTAFDVAGMNLLGTDLVVLSACDTGLGDVLVGEGVLGLRRSFQIAGARYVLMSLWRLSDREAVRQMRTFYTAYTAGKNPVLALRDTQLKRISRLRQVLGQAPPALWGALTIQGL